MATSCKNCSTRAGPSRSGDRRHPQFAATQLGASADGHSDFRSRTCPSGSSVRSAVPTPASRSATPSSTCRGGRRPALLRARRAGRRGGRRPNAQPAPGTRRRFTPCTARRDSGSCCTTARRSRPGRAAAAPRGRLHHAPAGGIGDYTDFYVGIHHATNVGKLFRPDNPLLPNYKWVPIGYHGRASTIRPSGVPVRRPNGQRKRPDDEPDFGPCRNLDYELELGVWIGPGNERSRPISVGEAAEHVAGYCLLNDWSARDIQAAATSPPTSSRPAMKRTPSMAARKDKGFPPQGMRYCRGEPILVCGEQDVGLTGASDQRRKRQGIRRWHLHPPLCLGLPEPAMTPPIMPSATARRLRPTVCQPISDAVPPRPIG